MTSGEPRHVFVCDDSSRNLLFRRLRAADAVILLKRSYKHGRRKSSSAPIERIARPTSKWDGAQRDKLAQVERQKVDMYDMARDLNGQLSSRIIVLEQLVGESQRQIERLETLLAEAEQAKSEV